MRELPERAEPILKIVCLILAVLVIYDLVEIVVRWNPFRGVTVPALPSLTASTNHPAGGAPDQSLAAKAVSKGTNAPPRLPATNTAMWVAGANTNPASQKMSADIGTNSTAQTVLVKTNGNLETNLLAHLETKWSGTNWAAATNSINQATNILASTNAGGTNVVVGTNSAKQMLASAPMPDMAGMNFNPFGPTGKRGADIPLAIQTRINRIVDSEVLGPVMHPLPMALLGIAGEFAFLRSANGQTGLVKEGDSLADLKLLRIGINRVLVEQGGQNKELMIFSGYGGDSLLPTNTPDENKH
jgi:hypothetical protein